jgi:hypothetical protein
MKFELDLINRNVPDEDLIKDLQKVANENNKTTVTIAEYEKQGKFHPSTFQRRFRSWFKALEIAGLEKSRSDLNIPDTELFENIKNVWIKLGRQPKYNEVKSPTSKYSAGT